MASSIHDFDTAHLGQRCFIIGSGPSLNLQDLAPLKDELTFTCNRGHLIWPRIGGPSTYWCVEDVLDVQQWADEFRRLSGTVKFIADDIGELGADSVLVPLSRERFSVEQGPRWGLEPPFMWGATVSYMMLQLAVYMGCDPIYLLGHDFNYTRLASFTTTDDLNSVEVWRNEGPDVDHFDESYWPEGSRAFGANLPLMRSAFAAARYVGDSVGTRIVNLTPGSKLDVFERGVLSEVLHG